MQVKCAVCIWHLTNTTAVFAGYLFLINGALSLWNDECVKREMRKWRRSFGRVTLEVIRTLSVLFLIISFLTCSVAIVSANGDEMSSSSNL